MTSDISPFLIILAVIVAGFGLLFWWLNKRLSSPTQQLDSNEIVNTVISVAQQKLSGDKQQIATELAAKKDAIEAMIKDLKTDIEVRQKEIRSLEQDRNLKFGEISKSIEEHKKLTSELQGSTNELKRVLSSSQLRGSWGERQVEQIFHNAGFLEGHHYFMQQPMQFSASRPDFTVILPNHKKICIDAKFPLANLQLMSQTDDKLEKQRLDKLFAADVKARINEVASKGYISEADGTCDYAVMFVPSEAVFEYINKQHSELVDEALGKKVLMASPYSLVAIVRTVLEAHKHFMVETSLAEILKRLSLFIKDYEAFQNEFGKVGRDLKTIMADYDQIASTRYKQMDLHMRQIQEARKGTKQLAAESVEVTLLETVVDGDGK